MKGLVRLSGYSTGLKIVRFALGIGSAALLTWLMPVNEYGLYSYTLAIAALLAIPGEAGMPNLVIREISRARVEKNDARVRGITRFANLTVLVLTLAMGAVAGTGLWLLGARVPADLTWPLIAVFPALLLGALANTRSGVQRALGSPIASQLPEQVVRPTALILFSAGAWFVAGGSIDATIGAISSSLASAVSFAVGTVLLVRTWRAKVGPGPAESRTLEWLTALLPFSAIAGLQVALVQVSMIVLGFYAPPSEIATFRIAMLGSDLAMFSTFAINTVVAPQIAAMLHRGEKAELQLLLGRVNRLNVLFAMSVAAGIAIAGYWALGLVFGDAYRASWLPMFILALGHLFGVSMGFVTTLTNMAGREKATMVAAVFGLGLNLLLSLILCPLYGPLGAAIAAATTAVAWRLTLAIYLYRVLDLRAWAFSRDFSSIMRQVRKSPLGILLPTGKNEN